MERAVPPASQMPAYGPGQVTVAMPAPSSAPVVSQRDFGFKPHHQRTMRNLSALQILIGIFCILIYIVLLAIKRSAGYYYTDYNDRQSAGIWCGAMYIIAGSLGVVAVRLNRLSLIIAAMIFSILSSIILWVVIGFAIAAIDTSVRIEDRPCYDYYDYGYRPAYIYCAVRNFSGYKAADSILLILSVAELVTSVWCAVLCCKGSCKTCCRCCCYGNDYGYPASMMYYAQTNSAGPQVIFVPQAGVLGNQAINFMPAQPSYLGVPQQQQPVFLAHPAAGATAPSYFPDAFQPPRYSASPIRTGATDAASCGQPVEDAKATMAGGY